MQGQQYIKNTNWL